MARCVIIVGGGAAGFLGAITCAEANAGLEVMVFEKGPHFLSKVRISGGGRCNVTHACFDPRDLTAQYPRGERALIAPFQRFHARHTVDWFAERGVRLKTEPDGRMFPITDSSQTIINCLLGAAQKAGVKLFAGRGIESVVSADDRRFKVMAADGESFSANCVLLATGGCRSAMGGRLAVALGHSLEVPVPSLFTFHIEIPWLRGLAGISVAEVEAAAPSCRLREKGPILITHWGLSGPVVLRLSAWGARALHACNYSFELVVNWIPDLDARQLGETMERRRREHPAARVVNGTVGSLPLRLWAQLVMAAGIGQEMRWSEISAADLHRLVGQLIGTRLTVSGKSLNKEEFVTCGGVRLNEVNLKTMESRVCPGLYLAGELLDIDGITGGFNFQSAWTTGWIAGMAMAQEE